MNYDKSKKYLNEIEKWLSETDKTVTNLINSECNELIYAEINNSDNNNNKNLSQCIQMLSIEHELFKEAKAIG